MVSYKSVVIFGGAAGSKITQDIFELNGLRMAGFANNFLSKEDRSYLHASAIKYEDAIRMLISYTDIGYFVSTGDNFMRKGIIESIVAEIERQPLNAIHPTAVLSQTAKLGYGNLIMPLAVLNSSAKIGNGTIINTHSVIEHDNVIEDYAQISPGACLGGYVTVKKFANVSLGVQVNPHLTIGEGSIIASGAAVTVNVPDYQLWAGVPAVYKKDVEPSES